MSVAEQHRVSQAVDFEDLLTAKMQELAAMPTRSLYFRRKALVDRVLAALLLIPGLPIIAVLTLLVRITSKGPGLYRQSRVGKDGRTFMMYKIRTMTHNAEAETGAVWTQAGDARITRVGKLLRKVHLDEFPQLINVLRGEMSLVGPRPERPEFVYVLAQQVPNYLRRLAIPPGITGLAQINLPPDSDLESVRRKLALDLEYFQRANVLLDLRMLLCTLFRLVGFSGEQAMRIMRLQREVPGDDNPAPSARATTPAALLITSSATKPGGNGQAVGKSRERREA